VKVLQKAVLVTYLHFLMVEKLRQDDLMQVQKKGRRGMRRPWDKALKNFYIVFVMGI